VSGSLLRMRSRASWIDPTAADDDGSNTTRMPCDVPGAMFSTPAATDSVNCEGLSPTIEIWPGWIVSVVSPVLRIATRW
jgi:hypothetical protein